MVCNHEQPHPIPCDGFAYRGSFIHDSHLALKDGKVVQIKPYPKYNISPIFEKCPTCLNYSCNCLARERGDFNSLGYDNAEVGEAELITNWARWNKRQRRAKWKRKVK